jgi:hypothetical protein
MRVRLPVLLLVLLPALLLSAGCSWFAPSLEVRVQVPEAPEHWRRAFPELRFQLDCPQADPWQSAALRGTLPDGLPEAPAGGSMTLRLPKRVNWPVLAYPWARGVRLPPAGGLFPLDLAPEGDALILRWEHGPAAEVFQALAREGFDLACLNARRLLEEMLARSAGDPGCLDLDHLGSCLASGHFRVTDLRLLPARDLELELEPGSWFPDSPFRPAQTLRPGQALLLPALPLGRHRLFAVEMPGGFDLYVGERQLLLVPLAGD